MHDVADWSIYFIGILNARGQPRPIVKIGIAKNPLERVNQLQTANPDVLWLEAAISLGTCPRQRAAQREATLHRRFAQYHIRGEWFERRGDLAALVSRAAHGGGLKNHVVIERGLVEPF